ncbi:MAG: galactokinase [Thermoleophilia bacterium]|nr:galactokinase [Thermoleophilia bacterium]
MAIETLGGRALEAFAASFGGRPAWFAHAPGRVELLGNHTDYNGGLVLAAAIDRYTVVAGRARDGAMAAVRAVNFEGDDTFPCVRTVLERTPAEGWSRYVRGVYWALTQHGVGRGAFEAAVVGEVPLGAGLSSSASLQASLGTYLIADGIVPRPDGASDDDRRMALAKALRRGENDFVGVGSGLLDQFAVLFGEAGRALTLDCRDLSYERLPLGPRPPAIVVCDSKTSRRLADGMYNRRREECQSVVTSFQGRKGLEVVTSLRDITLDELGEAWDDLDPVGRRRARHVLTENDRVRHGAEALKAGDLAGFGRLMSASHASSRDDFENSSPPLDALIEAAEAAPGFLGGKLTGAGWAGCTVNLVEQDRAEAFSEAVSRGYERRQGRRPEIHLCLAADGAKAVPA